MRLDFTNAQQLTTFLWSVALGAAFCLLYDVMRFLVASYKSGGIVVFISDTLFFAVCGVVTFVFFLLFSKGTIRFYVLLGELIGFAIFRIIFSRVVRGTLKLTVTVITKLLTAVAKPLEWLLSSVTGLAKLLCKYLCRALKSFGNLRTLIVKYRVRNAKKVDGDIDKTKKVE